MDEKYSEWCEKNIFKLFCNLSKSKIFQLALLGATAMQLGAVYLQCPPPPCRPGGELERPAEGGGAGPDGRAGRPAAWLRGAGGEAGGEPAGGGGVVGGGEGGVELPSMNPSTHGSSGTREQSVSLMPKLHTNVSIKPDFPKKPLVSHSQASLRCLQQRAEHQHQH